MTTLLDLTNADDTHGSGLMIDPAAADLLFRNAHTAYGFTDQPVTDAQIEAIHDLMRFGPTAMNTQPLRIILVQTPEAKARLIEHVAEGNRAKAQSAPIIAILAADTDFHEHLERVLPQAPNAKDMFADDAAREAAARFNATLQAGYFIVAVRAAGLDAGPMGGYDAAGVDREVLGDGPLKSIMLVNIGVAAESGNFPRNPRLGFDEVVSSI